MAGNRDVVSVLHFVGAEDGYIAREFQRHFLLLGLRGGLIGAGAAARHLPRPRLRARAGRRILGRRRADVGAVRPLRGGARSAISGRSASPS
jgi:hypothetical protein